jgi:hypothetical protein
MVARGAAEGDPPHVRIDGSVLSGLQRAPAVHHKFYAGLAATRICPQSFAS